jgi:predicted deacetylase
MSVTIGPGRASRLSQAGGADARGGHGVGGARPTAVPRPAKLIAVALHDIEPATFEKSAVTRDWLYDHGIDHVTLLVIPARDLHPAGQRSPAMIDWLTECRRAGDTIAQHGFQHERSPHRGWRTPVIDQLADLRGAEFRGLDENETRRAVEAGWRLLKLDGIEPTGFVAPAFAYTSALRETLSARFSWWAGLLRVHTRNGDDRRPGGSLAPALCLDTSRLIGRTLSPPFVRAGAALSGRTLRVDLHPADLRSPRHMMALEHVLQRAGRRRAAVNYDELAALTR